MARHFGIIEDSHGLCSSTVGTFLNEKLSKGQALVGRDEMVGEMLNTRCLCPPALFDPSPAARCRHRYRHRHRYRWWVLEENELE